jgi:hypothetical protein
MKKIISIFVALFVVTTMMANVVDSLSYAEKNKVYGVAGVKFGDSKQSVKNVILTKSDGISSEDSHCITFCKVSVGGRKYDYAEFYFTEERGLVSVDLQCGFDEPYKEEALERFDNVLSQFERKYGNIRCYYAEEDYTAYDCGAYIEGYPYRPIDISFQRSLSVGGEFRYYIHVQYYQQNVVGIYDDEI